MHVLALLLFSTIPVELVARDQCDVCELNYMASITTGEVQLAQVVWFDYYQSGNRHVREWRMNNKTGVPAGRRMVFMDCGTLRDVTADTFIHTLTFYDPEVLDRAVLPEKRRVPFRSLSRVRGRR